MITGVTGNIELPLLRISKKYIDNHWVDCTLKFAFQPTTRNH